MKPTGTAVDRTSPFADLAADLTRLSAVGRRRKLEAPGGLDFTSNDYLGFADSTELRAAAVEALSRQVPVGAGGSRLLRGNHSEHEALEHAAASYFGAQSALYFASGYTANLTLFATAPQRGDLVVHDERIHASVHDGLRRSRAEIASARHNDIQSIDDSILRWRTGGGTGRVWIAVESLYSMDGDGPDLAEIAALAGHRDGLFRPLRDVQRGDPIILRTPDREFQYEVEWTAVVLPTAVTVIQPTNEPALTLVTCFPFHYIGAAPERFVVRAHRAVFSRL